MPDVAVDGSWGLDDQARSLNDYQQQEGARVVAYATEPARGANNVATLQDLDLGAPVPVLVLVPIPAGGNPSAVQPANASLTFDSVVLVQGTATRVAGFHSAG